MEQFFDLGWADYEAVATLNVDFAASTISGCIGCGGTMVGVQRGVGFSSPNSPLEVSADFITDPAGYEIHLGEATFDSAGHFQTQDVTVTHTSREVRQTTGLWGGEFSNIALDNGNPRLVSGLNSMSIIEADGGYGRFIGIIIAPHKE